MLRLSKYLDTWYCIHSRSQPSKCKRMHQFVSRMNVRTVVTDSAYCLSVCLCSNDRRPTCWRRWKKHYSDVPSIMRNANMAAAFGALANRFLCSESFNFLVSVTEFRAFTGMMGAGPGLQHMLFNDICKVSLGCSMKGCD